MKPFVLLVMLTVGPQPHHLPSAMGFDSMDDCLQALARWAHHMQEYSVRNGLDPRWKELLGDVTAGFVFEAGVATCSPYSELTPAGKAAADSSP